jgi:molecular chaperone DnaJ
MATENYYDILGVPRDATDSDVKKAFRKLAKEHHPDTGGDAEQFKKIGEAYAVLSDPDKRRQYDSPQPQFFQGAGIDPTSIFEDFFFRGNRRNNPRPQNILHVTLELGIEDAYNGTTTTFTYERNRIKGAEVACAVCNGAGYTEQVMDIGMGRAMHSRSTCPVCNGSGRFFPAELERVSKTMNIPSGLPEGVAMTCPNEGHEYAPNQFGDMYLLVKTAEKNGYHREGQHLVKDLRVPFPSLIMGGDLHFDVFGKTYKVSMKKGADVLQTLRMRGLGFSFNGEAGDLYIRITPDIPEHLTSKEKKLLAELMEQEHFKP